MRLIHCTVQNAPNTKFNKFDKWNVQQRNLSWFAACIAANSLMGTYLISPRLLHPLDLDVICRSRIAFAWLKNILHVSFSFYHTTKSEDKYTCGPYLLCIVLRNALFDFSFVHSIGTEFDMTTKFTKFLTFSCIVLVYRWIKSKSMASE